jgi:hypothetical protein
MCQQQRDLFVFSSVGGWLGPDMPN